MERPLPSWFPWALGHARRRPVSQIAGRYLRGDVVRLTDRQSHDGQLRVLCRTRREDRPIRDERGRDPVARMFGHPVGGAVTSGASPRKISPSDRSCEVKAGVDTPSLAKIRHRPSQKAISSLKSVRGPLIPGRRVVGAARVLSGTDARRGLRASRVKMNSTGRSVADAVTGFGAAVGAAEQTCRASVEQVGLVDRQLVPDRLYMQPADVVAAHMFARTAGAGGRAGCGSERSPKRRWRAVAGSRVPAR